MDMSDYTNSLNPNESSETVAPFNNELPSSKTRYDIQDETSVSNTAAYAGYNPNGDNGAPELGAVMSPIGEGLAPLILFVVLYIVRIIQKERKNIHRLHASRCKIIEESISDSSVVSVKAVSISLNKLCL